MYKSITLCFSSRPSLLFCSVISGHSKWLFQVGVAFAEMRIEESDADSGLRDIAFASQRTQKRNRTRPRPAAAAPPPPPLRHRRPVVVHGVRATQPPPPRAAPAPSVIRPATRRANDLWRREAEQGMEAAERRSVGLGVLHPGAGLPPMPPPPPSLRWEFRTDSRAETACLESVSETVPSLHLGLVHGKKLIGLGAVRRLRSSLGSRRDVCEPVTEKECLNPEETESM